jgi:deoxyribodipyrimidine photo-lyase
MQTSIMWFRRDLRLADQTALHEALKQSKTIVPVYIFDPAFHHASGMQARQTAFLFETLKSLDTSLAKHNAKLTIRIGHTLEQLQRLVDETKAEAIFFNINHEPKERARDRHIYTHFKEKNIKLFYFEDDMIHGTDTILKSDKKPYTVFTPYHKNWLTIAKKKPHPAPLGTIHTIPNLKSDPLPTLEELKLTLDIPLPSTSETTAQKQLKDFCSTHLSRYTSQRDIPALNATSHLSIPLRFGLISARTTCHAANQEKQKHPQAINDIDTFIKELAWRDFYKMILWHFPHVETNCFHREYDSITWENDEQKFTAWREGRTGYPIVDAAMRQLNQTGWMHNRLRMIVASFLTKDLLIDWKWGETYFAEKLLDWDLSANTGGWQWSASVGTDAQPYFRIFNPTRQAETFDPDGKFIEKFIPEANQLNHLPHIVDHTTQRLKAIQIFKTIHP